MMVRKGSEPISTRPRNCSEVKWNFLPSGTVGMYRDTAWRKLPPIQEVVQGRWGRLVNSCHITGKMIAMYSFAMPSLKNLPKV